jgi:hypothetical protein
LAPIPPGVPWVDIADTSSSLMQGGSSHTHKNIKSVPTMRQCKSLPGHGPKVCRATTVFGLSGRAKQTLEANRTPFLILARCWCLRRVISRLTLRSLVEHGCTLSAASPLTLLLHTYITVQGCKVYNTQYTTPAKSPRSLTRLTSPIEATMLTERELQISPVVQESVLHNTKVSRPDHASQPHTLCLAFLPFPHRSCIIPRYPTHHCHRPHIPQPHPQPPC